MSNRETGAQHGAIAAIKVEERGRRAVVQRRHDAAPDNFADAFRAEMLALKIEVGDLFQGIEDAKARIELQAIDDLDLVSKPDVFRAQISMAVDDAPPLKALGKERFVARKKAAKQAVEMTDRARAQAQTRVQENDAVLLKVAAPMSDIGVRPHEHGTGVPIKAGKLARQRLDREPAGAPRRDETIEHPALIEAAHLHEPLDDFASAADCKPRGRGAQRNRIQIDIAGKPPVQSDFGAAGQRALFQRREVEIREADRLLELVDKAAGQKNPRHVGLADLHLAGGCIVGARVAQEGDFLFQGGN